MPNWTDNKIIIKGPKDALEKFIADGKVKVGEERVEDHDYAFSSWIPTPETFLKYDTTNHPSGNGLEIGKPERFWEDNSPIVTAARIREPT